MEYYKEFKLQFEAFISERRMVNKIRRANLALDSRTVFVQKDSRKFNLRLNKNMDISWIILINIIFEYNNAKIVGKYFKYYFCI